MTQIIGFSVRKICSQRKFVAKEKKENVTSMKKMMTKGMMLTIMKRTSRTKAFILHYSSLFYRYLFCYCQSVHVSSIILMQRFVFILASVFITLQYRFEKRDQKNAIERFDSITTSVICLIITSVFSGKKSPFIAFILCSVFVNLAFIRYSVF